MKPIQDAPRVRETALARDQMIGRLERRVFAGHLIPARAKKNETESTTI